MGRRDADAAHAVSKLRGIFLRKVVFMEEKICNLRITTKRGTFYEEQNLMLSDIKVDEQGVIIRTELGITIYHAPNVERTRISFIND
jgi:hypothetical protein